jgi:ABC-type multidrug transport system ATPase subunit
MKTAPPLSVQGLSIGGEPISFQVQPGEILAVLGDNGSGKSLLLAHLSGHLRVPPGSVQVAGRELNLALAEVGVVFQHPGLIRNMTVFENIALPFLVHGLDLDGELQEKVRLRMRLVGCGHLENEEVHGLSEGDKRCVSLARALSGRTRLLIADEPVAALAPAKKALVEELLVSLVRTGVLTGIVVATQDLDFARRIATHILLLHGAEHTLVRGEDAAQNERCQAFTTRNH